MARHAVCGAVHKFKHSLKDVICRAAAYSWVTYSPMSMFAQVCPVTLELGFYGQMTHAHTTHTVNTGHYRFRKAGHSSSRKSKPHSNPGESSGEVDDLSVGEVGIRVETQQGRVPVLKTSNNSYFSCILCLNTTKTTLYCHYRKLWLLSDPSTVGIISMGSKQPCWGRQRFSVNRPRTRLGCRSSSGHLPSCLINTEESGNSVKKISATGRLARCVCGRVCIFESSSITLRVMPTGIMLSASMKEV